MNNSEELIQGTLFEEHYLIRELGSIAHDPVIALTELVANAWDAGAKNVKITIPEEKNDLLTVSDDGEGMSANDFKERWMKLRYNRLKHQGNFVVLKSGERRAAFGKNGVGRHGLLCFNDEYIVETSKQSLKSIFKITTNLGDPMSILEETQGGGGADGTLLKVSVIRNLPNPEKIRDILASKFLHDPQFVIMVNGLTTSINQLPGLISEETIIVEEYKIKLTATVIDTQKSGKSSIYQGIVFWQNNRLIGEPSWSLNGDIIIDGRSRFAKRYTFVFQSDDLTDCIAEDWTGFKVTDKAKTVFREVSAFVKRKYAEISKDIIEETLQDVKNEFKAEFSSLSRHQKISLDESIHAALTLDPTAKQESIEFAVKAVMNICQSNSGASLLKKISELTDENIDNLNSILEKWNLRDAMTVLDEIDRRISIIEAIRRVSHMKSTDELHTLHPLILEARWVFGPEFESSEYISNRQIKTAAKIIFEKDAKSFEFDNPKNRCDIICLENKSVSVLGTEAVDPDTEIACIDKILIIELKKGGSQVGRDERNQAVGYCEDFLKCSTFSKKPAAVYSFLVGESIDKNLETKQKIGDFGHLNVITFGQLIDTANRRMFKLREYLHARYSIDDAELFQQPDVAEILNSQKK